MPPLLRALALSSCCVVLAGCATARSGGACPAERGAPWLELRSEHFRVRTDLEEAEATRALAQLERYRRVVLLDWVQHFDPPGVSEVVLLRDVATLRELTGLPGAWSGRLEMDGPLLLLSAEHLAQLGAEGWGALTPLYSLAYPLTWKAMPSEPRWLAEGLSRYVQTAQLEDNGAVTLGEPQRAALLALRNHGRLLSIGQLWNWGVHAPEHAGASAWLWVHYLLSAQPQRFSDFRTRLHREEEAYAAFQAAFSGVDWKHEQQQLAAYAMQGDYRIVRAQVPELPLRSERRSLEDGEVHLLRAELGGWGRHAEAAHQQRIQQERALAQQHDPAGFSTRWLALGALPKAQLLEGVRQLTREFPDRAEGWEALADLLAAAKAPAAEQAEAHVRALALAPQRPSVLNDYAWYFVNAGDAARALEPAREALRLAPHSAFVVDTNALVAAQLGRCQQAQVLQRRALSRIVKGYAGAPEMVKRLEDFEQRCTPAAATAPGP